MTRVPLTQPSTDLVGVTLDLILLIDQLLTVLRKRGGVLNLASLRLQWDDLRHEVSCEIESVRSEIDHVVAEAEAWLPGAGPAPERRLERRKSVWSNHSSQLNVSSSSGSPAEGSETPMSQSPASTSPNPRPASPTKCSTLNSSPSKPTGSRSGLHISILRSQLVGLQTRDQNLSHILVKRSGAILDRMIDSASRLEDLGGVAGPVPQEGKTRHGAIPDLLIDLQEELEARAKDIASTVEWCTTFESQSKQGQEHYASSISAKQLASEAMGDIQEALSQTPSASTHTELAERFAQANNALPSLLDDAFPQPTHSDYPTKDEHNAAILSVLRNARGAAQADVDVAGKLLGFYSSLLKAREVLLGQQKRMQQLRGDLLLAVERLERGSTSAPRPSLVEVVTDGGIPSDWMSHVPGWLDQGEQAERAAVDAHETTVLAIMQYRKALTNAPMAIKPYLPAGGVPDDLGAAVGDDASDVIGLARRCASLTKRTRLEADALPFVLRIRQDGHDIGTGATDLREELVRAINMAAWSTQPSSRIPDRLDEQLDRLAAQAAATQNDMVALRKALTSTEVVDMLSDTVKTNDAALVEARRELDIYTRVTKQAQSVRDIHVEAENLVASIVLAEGDNLDTEALAGLKVKVEEWNDGLTRRVPFVSGQVPPGPNWRGSGDDLPSSGPLTPPLTPVGVESSTVLPDLSNLDSRVRTDVNRQSARVTAALARLVTASDTAKLELWSGPVTDAVTNLDKATRAIDLHVGDLSQRLADVRSKEGEARLSLATELQLEGLTSLQLECASIPPLVSKLDDTLESGATPSFTQLRGADVLSTANQARESALQSVSKAEQWQEDVKRLVESSTAHEPPTLVQFKAAAPPTPAQPKAVTKAAPKTPAQPTAPPKVVSRTLARPKTAPNVPVPTTSQQTPQQSVKAIKSLEDRLDALQLDAVVYPSPEVLRTTPKHRRLPDSAMARNLSKQFSDIADNVRAVAKSQPDSPVIGGLVDKVNKTGALVPNLKALAAVSTAAAACDKSMSQLLDAIDSRKDPKAKLVSSKEAQAAVENLERVAEPHKGDLRVMKERERIATAWTELQSLAEGGSRPSSRTSSAVPSDETGSSTPALSKTIRHRPSLLSVRSARTASQPTISSEAKRVSAASRAVSDTTKGRTVRTRPSLDSMGPPQTPQGASFLSRPSSSARGRPPVSLPRQFRPAQTSDSNTTEELATPTRAAHASGSRSLVPSPKGDEKYTPHPQSRLDLAVGRILNSLDVSYSSTSLTCSSRSPWSPRSESRPRSGLTGRGGTGSGSARGPSYASVASCAPAPSWLEWAEAGSSCRGT